MAIRLVVGLGNPGRRYEHTRHNIGFRVVDELKDASSWVPWGESGEYGKAVFSEGVYLVRPLTFMNLSGRMVQDFSHFYKIEPSEMVVCYDDIDLPLGRIRIRLKGSSGGHRGMQSVVESLGTSEIPRLRIGIGPVPEGMDAAGFVLQRLGSQEESLLKKTLSDAQAAVKMAFESGIEAAMNRYNVSAEELS